MSDQVRDALLAGNRPLSGCYPKRRGALCRTPSLSSLHDLYELYAFFPFHTHTRALRVAERHTGHAGHTGWRRRAPSRADRDTISIFPCGHQAIMGGVFWAVLGPLSGPRPVIRKHGLTIDRAATFAMIGQR